MTKTPNQRNWKLAQWYTLDLETQPIIEGINNDAEAISVGFHKIGTKKTHIQFHGKNCLNDFYSHLKNISTNLKKAKKVKEVRIFVHNLGYDLSFIQPLFLDCGITPLDGKDDKLTLKSESRFSILCNGLKTIYSFKCIINGVRFIFVDSYKFFILPLSKCVDLIDEDILKDNPILRAKGDLNYCAFATYEKGRKKETYEKILKSPAWLALEKETQKKYPNFTMKEDLILFNDEEELKRQIGYKSFYMNKHEDSSLHLHSYLYKDCFILAEALKSFFGIIQQTLITQGISYRSVQGLYKKITIGGIAKYAFIKLGDYLHMRKYPGKYKNKKASPYLLQFEGIKKPSIQAAFDKYLENNPKSNLKPNEELKLKPLWVHQNIKGLDIWFHEWNGMGGGYTNIKDGLRSISKVENKKNIVIRKSKHFYFKPNKYLQKIKNPQDFLKKVNSNQIDLSQFKGVGGSADLISSYPSKMINELMPTSKLIDEEEYKKRIARKPDTKFQKWVNVEIKGVKKITKNIPAFFPAKKEFIMWRLEELDKTNENNHFISHYQGDKYERAAFPAIWWDFILKHYEVDYNKKTIKNYYYHLTDYFQAPVKLLYDLKKESSINGNKAKKQVFKLLINNIYGKTVEGAIRQKTKLLSWDIVKKLFNEDDKQFKLTFGYKNHLNTMKMINSEKLYKEDEIFYKNNEETNQKYINAANSLFLNGKYFEWCKMRTTMDYENLVFRQKPGKLSPIQVGAYITAISRIQLLNVINMNYDIWLYCDTDSIYVSDISKLKGIELSLTTPGTWNIETFLKEFKGIKPKCYGFISQFLNELNIKVAGKNKSVDGGLNDLESLRSGFIYTQLQPLMTNRGTSLNPVEKMVR